MAPRASALARLSAATADSAQQPAHPPRALRSSSRLPAILNEAARLFAQSGYHDTSIREIVRATGMLPGSLYCHFASKEDLLVAVYEEGVRRMLIAVSAAITDVHGDPWQRLERACVGHLEALLQSTPYALVVIRVLPDDVPTVRERLVALRDQFEALFVSLIAELPITPGTDRRTLRLLLLGALNWTQFWYRPGNPPRDSDTPATIARKMVALVRGNAA
jgi:AcrR family transcriptional regulator